MQALVARDGGNVSRRNGDAQDCDGAGLSVHRPDDVIGGVGDVEISGRIHRDVVWIVKLCAGGCLPVTAVGCVAVAGHGTDRPAGRNLADAVVSDALGRSLGVSDIEIAGCIQRNAEWGRYLSAGGGAAVAAVAGRAVTGNSADGSAGIHLADTAIHGVGNVEIAERVQRHSAGKIELRAGGRDAVAVVAIDAVTCYARDVPRANRYPKHGNRAGLSTHHPDIAAGIVGDIDVPGRVRR